MKIPLWCLSVKDVHENMKLCNGTGTDNVSFTWIKMIPSYKSQHCACGFIARYQFETIAILRLCFPRVVQVLRSAALLVDAVRET